MTASRATTPRSGRAPRLAALLLGLGALAPIAGSEGVEGPGPSIPWWTIDAGGGTSNGGGFTMLASVGQFDAGTMAAVVSGTTFELAGGFISSTTATPPCPADLNDDGVVNGADLAILLAFWGPCPSGPCSIADLTGDGAVNGADLTILLGDWGNCPT